MENSSLLSVFMPYEFIRPRKTVFLFAFFSLNCPKKDVFLLMRPYWQQSLQLELDCYTENVICQPQSYITIMLSDYSIFFCDSRKFTNHILFAYPQNISNRCKTNWLYHRRGWQNYVHLQSEILASIKCDNKFKDRMTIWTIWPVEKFHTKHTLPVCVCILLANNVFCMWAKLWNYKWNKQMIQRREETEHANEMIRSSELIRAEVR